MLVGEQGEPVGRISDGDAVIFFNFRADRARQITDALNDPSLAGIDRSLAPKNLHYVTMTQYDRRYGYPHVLPPHQPENTLAHISEVQGWLNLRVAETEKYPHVTYFFNGGREKPFQGEERRMVPSPRVATYDLQPEMSAPGVCDLVVDGVESGNFDWIVVNFANGDMVGHTGKLDAAVKAIETVDDCLGRIRAALDAKKGAWIVTADHGNADLMVDPETGQTAHLSHNVPRTVRARERLRGRVARRRFAPRHRAHDARRLRCRATRANDRTGSAAENLARISHQRLRDGLREAETGSETRHSSRLGRVRASTGRFALPLAAHECSFFGLWPILETLRP